jgi:hypothetical protein
LGKLQKELTTKNTKKVIQYPTMEEIELKAAETQAEHLAANARIEHKGSPLIFMENVDFRPDNRIIWMTLL